MVHVLNCCITVNGMNDPKEAINPKSNSLGKFHPFNFLVVHKREFMAMRMLCKFRDYCVVCTSDGSAGADCMRECKQCTEK